MEIARVSVVPQGHHLFRTGENDALAIFLLRGRVELKGDGRRMAVYAGTDAARYPLANLKPRRYDGRALTDVRIAHVDAGLLEKVVTWDQMLKGPAQGLEVEELNGGEDPEWFLHMLGNPIFMRVPTANIEALVRCFEPVPVKAAETVIEQGDPGRE